MARLALPLALPAVVARLALPLALAAVVASLALPMALPTAARADGDPPSDVLLGQDTYLPYAPYAPSAGTGKALASTVARAKRAGYAVKVAVVAATPDLGSVPQLLTDPQQYADLLTREIAFNSRPRVLVVLPTGLGGNNLGDDAGPALASFTPDGTVDGDKLTELATQAVVALARAAGHPIAAAAVDKRARKTSDTPVALVFGAPLLLVLVAAAGLSIRGRRADADAATGSAEASGEGGADAHGPLAGG